MSNKKSLQFKWYARRAVLLVAVIASGCLSASSVSAQVDESRRILKNMSDYVAAQKAISGTMDTDIEVVTPSLQKIQFASSGTFSLSRPDRFRATRSGGYSEVELVFDGAAATILGRHANIYTQVKSPGSFDQLVSRLRDEFGVSIAGADLLLTNPQEQLMTDVLEIAHIGHGVIDGVDCDHIAARGQEVDWQLWVEIGPRPIPRKYVITSKAVTGGPQYTLRIKTWSTEPISADSFVFKAPPGAKMVEPRAMPEIDEVPAAIVKGDKK